MKISTLVAALTSCLLLAVAGTAVAATPTQDAYSGVAGQQAGQGAVDDQGAGGPAGAPAAAASVAGDGETLEVLPFTGQQLLIVGIVGTLLIGSGLMLRRTSRRTE